MSESCHYQWVTLGEVADINPEALPADTAPDYRFRYIDLSSVDDGRVEIPVESVAFADAPVRARRRVQQNDILMATVRPLLHGFAPVAFPAADVICSTGFAVLRPRDSIDPPFLYYSLLAPWMDRQYAAMTAGSSYPALNASQVADLQIRLPDLGRQREAAKVLGCTDELRLVIDRLLAAKRQMKRGLMQQLLTGQMRFPGFEHEKWRSVMLGDLINYTPRKVTKPAGTFLSAGVRSHGKGVFLKEAFASEAIALDELFELHQRDLIVNITFGWEGAIAIVPGEADGALVSHRFPTYVIDESKVLVEFLRHVIRSKRFVFDVGVASPGGAGRNRVLNRKEFLEIPLRIPSLAEQERIGGLLNELDREIDLLAAQREKVDDYRRALLSKLLSGSLPVPL